MINIEQSLFSLPQLPANPTEKQKVFFSTIDTLNKLSGLEAGAYLQGLYQGDSLSLKELQETLQWLSYRDLIEYKLSRNLPNSFEVNLNNKKESLILTLYNLPENPKLLEMLSMIQAIKKIELCLTEKLDKDLSFSHVEKVVIKIETSESIAAKNDMLNFEQLVPQAKKYAFASADNKNAIAVLSKIPSSIRSLKLKNIIWSEALEEEHGMRFPKKIDCKVNEEIIPFIVNKFKNLSKEFTLPF